MHLKEEQLALHRSSEVGWLERMQVAAHLRGCEECRRRREEYELAQETLREIASEMPMGLDWERLSGEMTANINLGVTAGRIVAQVEPKPNHLTGWRPALVFASTLLVVVAAWYVNTHGPAVIPTNMVAVGKATMQKLPAATIAAPAQPTLEMDSAGIGLNDPNRVLTLRHSSRDAVFSVNMQGAVRARYVDAETGQVTINNVYVQ
ncbi:MAG: hypothetical protein JNK87_10850 [Bryobacterales bacterium]|nr:hypothetical protein [Bryobacterales bacterium]